MNSNCVGDRKEGQMNCFRKAAKTALLVLTMGALFSLPRASAQTEPPTPKSTDAPQSNETNTDEGWHVGITPYLWFAGVHGTAGALGHDASVHATFGDIFDYLNIGAMGVVETRYNRVLMPLDFMWMKLSDNKAIPLDDPEAASIIGTSRQALTCNPLRSLEVSPSRRIGLMPSPGEELRQFFLGRRLSRFWAMRVEALRA